MSKVTSAQQPGLTPCPRCKDQGVVRLYCPVCHGRGKVLPKLDWKE